MMPWLPSFFVSRGWACDLSKACRECQEYFQRRSLQWFSKFRWELLEPDHDEKTEPTPPEVWDRCTCSPLNLDLPISEHEPCCAFFAPAAPEVWDDETPCPF